MSRKSESGNPYVGPRPFTQEDRDLFFGREREARDLFSLVLAHQVVVFYAQSGAGKTSLLNARLIPMLEEEGFDVLLGRVGGETPRDIDTTDVPNVYVYNYLLGCVDESSDPAELVRRSLAEFLADREHIRDKHGLLLPRALIIDQFEELFITYADRWRDREGFFGQLGDAVQQDSLLRAVLVLRDEHLARLERYVAPLPKGAMSRFSMERLRQPAALQAIKGPLARADRRFADGVAEKLVGDLLTIHVESEPAGASETVAVVGEFVEPVHIQVVCQDLWSKLTAGTDEVTDQHLAMVQVDEALAELYEQAIQAAAETGVGEEALRDWCEQHLITSVGTLHTAHRGVHDTEGIPNAAVDVLQEEHLIRAERRAGARWYELTHDRFIEPIRKSNERARSERAERRAARKRRSLLALGPVLAVLAAIAIVALFVWGQGLVGQQQREAERQAREAERRARVTESLQFAARVPEALATDRERGLLLATHAVSLTYPVDATYKIEAYAALWQALDSPPHAILRGHVAAVRHVAFDAEGERIVTASADKTARLWDLQARLTATLAGHSGPVNTANFSPDGHHIITGSGDGTARLWDTNGQPSLTLVGHADSVNQAVFSPDGQLILTASSDHTARLWSIDGSPLVTLTGHTAPVNKASFAPDGQLLVTASGDATARLWRTDGRPLANLMWHTGAVSQAKFSPGGGMIVTASADGRARLWDDRGNNIAVLVGHTDAVLDASFSPDGQRIVTASADGTARLWDVEGRPLVILLGHTDAVNHAVFSPDGRLVATSSSDGTTRLWHRDGQLVGALSGRAARALHAAFSPDGQLIVTAKAAGAARLHFISIDELIALAQSRATRSLTPEELATYGGDTLVVPTPTPTQLPSSPGPTSTPSATPTAAPPPGMVLIPAGSFQMGSSQPQIEYALELCQEHQDYDRHKCELSQFGDESPPRSVYLDEFFIDVYEVTNVEYRECVDATVCAPPKETWSGTRWTYYQGAEYDDYPVIWVSWHDAKAYCDWVGKRLPTEAEWEKAARGTDARIWPWGDEWDPSRLNCCDPDGNTSAVGGYPAGASPNRVHDMAGNASEWVADCYRYDYYAQAPDRNPSGPFCPADPDTSQLRVLRGGSWSYPPRWARAADRSSNAADSQWPNIGFRCAR